MSTGSFSTFFGDYLHGLWVTWYTDESLGATGFKAHFYANYRARLYTWTTTPLAPDASKEYDFTFQEDGATAMADGDTWDVGKWFQFYVQWDNPNSAETVTKDGILILVKCELTAGTPIATAKPTLACNYADTTAGGAAHTDDIKPTVNYDTNTYDSVNDVVRDTDIYTSNSNNLCTEEWYLGDNTLACVEMQAGASRKFSTGDTAEDFILDYVEYTMYAKFGETEVDTDDVFRFSGQTVNFNNLLAADTNALLGFQIAGLSAVASMFAMLG